jgi:hypothetical protein
MKMVYLSPGIACVILNDSVNYSLYHRKLYDWSKKEIICICDMKFKLNSIEIKEDTERELCDFLKPF